MLARLYAKDVSQVKAAARRILEIACARKSAYIDREGARRACQRMAAAGRIRQGERMAVYRCKVCCHWHIGHLNDVYGIMNKEV